MAKLFIRPSQVVERLRNRFAYIKSKYATFPTAKIIAATDSDLAEYLTDSDCKQPNETTIYVGGGLSVGDLITSAGPAESNITTGISIILAIGTKDEHAKITDELATLFKEAIVLSLHGWQWENKRTPLYFVNDSIIKVKGNAVMIRAYEFAHEILISYTDIDDAFDLFDNLEYFTTNKNINKFDTAPIGDIATINAQVDIDIPT